MRRAFVFLAAASIAVVAIPVAASAGASAAPTKTFSIVFDGYCDGLSLNMPSTGLPGTAFSIDGAQTGKREIPPGPIAFCPVERRVPALFVDCHPAER